MVAAGLPTLVAAGIHVLKGSHQCQQLAALIQALVAPAVRVLKNFKIASSSQQGFQHWLQQGCMFSRTSRTANSLLLVMMSYNVFKHMLENDAACIGSLMSSKYACSGRSQKKFRCVAEPRWHELGQAWPGPYLCLARPSASQTLPHLF